MFEIHADRQECQGYGNCVLEAPETFDLDDAGLVVVLHEQPAEADRTQVLAAIRSCPVRALTATG